MEIILSILEVNMTEKNKKCPFCGNFELSFLVSAETYSDSDSSGPLDFLIICDPDDGGCGVSTGPYPTKEEALAAWNKRISDEI